MLIVPRASVRTNLTLAILLTVVLSWVISGGVANYFNYLSLRALRQEMLTHPNAYSHPIPEPRFGIVEFLTGRPPIHREWRPGHDPGRPRGPQIPRVPPPPGEPQGPPPRFAFELRGLAVRLVIALGLAVLAGAWLGRRFTKPLTQLAKGADAFQSGDLAYRIPGRGRNEFEAVATAMNGMAQQVSDHISRLENDAERRKQLLADIAHELRSPVTTMRTMAGALQDGVAEEPERRERALAALVGTSERMLRLVQDLMELAKLDLEDFPLSIGEVDLHELAQSVIHSHETQAAAAGITIHPLAPGGAVKARVDPDRMIQVLDNIMQNAIAYAGEGAEVRVTLTGGDPVQISISDTGKGIPAEDVQRVLDPFYRADAARTPGDCHSGLGLSIASRLVAAHNGTLTVTSGEGQGTAVTITIPGIADGCRT